MFFARKVTWSPVEIDYLKKHQKDDIMQLTIALSKSRNAIKNKILELNGKALPPKPRKAVSKTGKRKDLKNIFFRSGWEANCARYFNHKKIKWEYEPKVFVYEKIKHGTVSYCPDFYLPGEDKWVEVKGLLKPKDRAAIKRFKLYYPEEFKKLVYITGTPNTKATDFFKSINVPVMAYMSELNKEFKKIIPNWE